MRSTLPRNNRSPSEQKRARLSTFPSRGKLMGAGFGKPAPRSMHPTIVESHRSRRYPVLVACCTFALVVAGALVTSNDAAGSIPDWPLNWGRIIPPLEANIRYEFAHRALAAVVLLLVAGLAWRERTKLAWVALGTVIAQAAVGGLLVKWIDPASLDRKSTRL